VSILLRISSTIKSEIVNASSDILSLSPFLESRQMRVDGRLKNSNLAFNACHPILLPRKHILTHINSAYMNTHETYTRVCYDSFRAPALSCASAFVRQRFRVPALSLSLRSTVRGMIQKCITCFRANQSEALMGSLPASRVNVSRFFSRCDVDYAALVTWGKSSKRAELQSVRFAFCVLRHEVDPPRISKWPYVRSLYCRF